MPKSEPVPVNEVSVPTDAKTPANVVTLRSGKQVTLREPLLRDIRQFFSIENLEERQVQITITLAEMPEDEMTALHYSDYMKLARATESFLS